ncbi:MAG: N-acyl-D-amino-acid deacylase [Acidimicrobiaceae bacterium]|jgi:N-acyl-D-aspartate/D-glutamate deacylase
MDLVLRGGRVIDGTGAPARSADVGVEGDRIVAVGDIGSTDGAEVVDLGGLVLAPGFVDIHTHYDAQVTWDGDLTPSCWHGVTSVVMGNCGFSIAPTRPGDRGVIARTLENVEGMSVEALTEGIDWSFETFPEYLDALDRTPTRLNVAAMIGHTALRIYTLGDEATERAATAEEVERMRAIVGEAIDAGAIGFASSKSPTHSGDAGKPVPSRFAEIDEITRIASVMGEKNRGTFQATIGPGFYVKEMAALSEEIGRPVTWTALLTLSEAPGHAKETLDKQAALGGEVWPQIACRPLVFQITLEDPFPFAMAKGFDEILAAPRAARADIYSDPEWRDRVRPELDRVWGHTWGKDWIDETEKHVALRQGPSIAEIAAARGQHPMDAMIDLALEEDLKTRFAIVLANDGNDEIGELLNDNRAVIGLSDAGAHASQICDACFSTHLLGHWVRERQAISLEQAVHRLTAHAAHVFRIPDRGVIRAGAFADLCAFDPDTVGVAGVDRVFDLPSGADRLLARSSGIEHVWVNGQAIRLDGKDVDGARPGRLIRGGTA